jgi:HAD superfamily hydrolase (TIGR01450 family)
MTDRTPLDEVDVVLADLDGVIYRGQDAVTYAVESINLAAESRRVGYITNNASRTPRSVAEQLQGLGLRVSPDEIVTSPQAAVRLLSGLVEPGALILAVGGEGLRSELEKAGFPTTASAEDRPAAVIQGFADDLGWRQLAEAGYALQDGGPSMPWVATNTDWTLPTARGIAPGNGTLVSAVHSAVGRLPVVAGKPEVAIFEEAIDRFGGSKQLFVGDRLDTDILGANRAGLDSLLVLTGVDQAKQVLAADRDSRPTYLLEDLRGLHEPYPETIEETTRDGARIVTVGRSIVGIRQNTVTILEAGGSRIDLLRAGAAAIWGSGLAIYGLEVPQDLYA